MSKTENLARLKPLAIVFLVSLVSSQFVYFLLPMLLPQPDQSSYLHSHIPGWVLVLSIALGAVAVVTVPFAWRWLFLRRNQ